MLRVTTPLSTKGQLLPLLQPHTHPDQVDVDVHVFGLIGRKGLNGFLPRIWNMVLDFGMVRIYQPQPHCRTIHLHNPFSLDCQFNCYPSLLC